MNLEIRSNQVNLETNDDNQMRISGKVNDFQFSKLIHENGKRFYERIERGAFARAIEQAKAEKRAIDLLGNHDKTMLLASTQNDSLRLEERDDGLYFDAVLVDTDYARNYHALAKSNLICECSFGFRVIEDEFKRNGDGTYNRYLKDIELSEVSITRVGAYNNTVVNARHYEGVDDMTLEELMIRKDNIIDQIVSLNQTCVDEKRSFTRDEEQRNKSLENELNYIKEEIRNAKEQLRNMGAVKHAKGMSNNMAKDLNYELRNLTKEKGLIDVSECEYRANVVTSDANTTLGSNTQHKAPVNFIQGVIMGAQHDNFLISNCNIVQTANETKLTVADFMDEMKELKELDEISFEDFTTTEKTVALSRRGCATLVSRQLIDSANFNVVGHVATLFSRSLAKTIESMIAKALDNDSELESKKVVLEEEQYALDAIITVLAKMPETLRANACIFVNPDDYAEILTYKDSDGRNLLDFQYQNSLRAYVCGVPIIVSEKVKGMYVGSLRQACVVGLNVRSIDTELISRRDAYSFSMNSYMGATVVLPSALVKIARA